MNELFILDNESLIDINKVWISTVRDLKAILSRDRGSPGDTQGRKKLQAKKEFTFIYHMVDYRSPYEKYEEKSKIEEAIKNADLPDDFDYTKDRLLVNALNCYAKIQETTSLRLLSSARKALFTANKVVETYNDAIMDTLDNVSTLEITEQGIEESKSKMIKESVGVLLDAADKLIKLTNSIPNAIDNLEKREERVKKELASGGKVKGGHEEGYNSMMLTGT